MSCPSPPPSIQGFQNSGTALESLIFDLLMNMQGVLLLASPCPIPLFLTHTLFHHCFSWCAVGERGQPHPSTEWHSMSRRKGEEKSCLVLPLMSKSMHLSLKRGKGRKREGCYWDPKDQAKTLTQKQLPHAMNRSLFFNSAQQYISPEPLIEQSCN